MPLDLSLTFTEERPVPELGIQCNMLHARLMLIMKKKCSYMEASKEILERYLLSLNPKGLIPDGIITLVVIANIKREKCMLKLRE
jgi:hypothetical protein